jgi:hypothetical protein
MTTLKESKAAKAFQRKLLIAWCIDQHPGNLTHLQKLTGMPRRTLQDAIKDLDDLSIECSFQQTEGALNNQGVYKIDQWGCIDSDWVNRNISAIAVSLGIELQFDY